LKLLKISRFAQNDKKTPFITVPSIPGTKGRIIRRNVLQKGENELLFGLSIESL